MLAEILHSFSAAVYDFKHLALHPSISIAILWVVWRLWTFTIEPRLRPLNPPVLPYDLPLVGHTISFLWNREELLSCGRLIPYSIHLIK